MINAKDFEESQDTPHPVLTPLELALSKAIHESYHTGVVVLNVEQRHVGKLLAGVLYGAIYRQGASNGRP